MVSSKKPNKTPTIIYALRLGKQKISLKCKYKKDGTTKKSPSNTCLTVFRLIKTSIKLIISYKNAEIMPINTDCKKK